MDDFKRLLSEPLTEYAGRVIGALLLLGLGWLALRFLVSPLRRLLERSRVDPSAASFLANSARTALLVVVLLGALQQLGVHTASLLTLLGTVGLALALSLQGSLANFASGLMVLSFRTVRVGDLVEVGGIQGRVAELLPFHIVLVSDDNQRITVPNTNLTTGPVRNYTSLASRRAQWTLPLGADDDLNAVKEALRARLQADRRILPEPGPRLYVQEWDEKKRVLTVQAWTATADFPTVQQELLEELGMCLEKSRQRAANSE